MTKYQLPAKFSPQQTAFIDWCRTGSGSCILEAVAGSGKTTTLLGAVANITGQVAILAYNKKIADEIKNKLADLGIDWKKCEAGTVHSFGFRAYRKAFPKVKLDDYKVLNIIDVMIAKYSDPFLTEAEAQYGKFLTSYKGTISKLVSMAKQRAVGVLSNIDDISTYREIIEHYGICDDDLGSDKEIAIVNAAIKVLQESNAQTEIVDFDDMVYLPLIYKIRFWQYDFVIVDEAQDLSAARRALVRAIVKKGGRVAGVGDRHQSIYGFSGADNDSLDQLGRDFNAASFPLTVTYRCPKSVVNFSRKWVSHIEAHETAPEGTTSTITTDELMVRNDLDGSSAILSRVTAPLVNLAFKFIRAHVACKIEGRDIGTGLKKLATKWSTIKTISALEDKLEDYLAKETTKFLAKKQEAKLQILDDQISTLRTIMDQCRLEQKTRVDDVIFFIDELFSDNVKGILVLSTIHKSKGREFDNVFWLDRTGTCPSKWARQAWQLAQENNLCYVAATRARQNLIEVVPV
jgi:DNA helicase II / ATP-dependent DNA helicase PcrA